MLDKKQVRAIIFFEFKTLFLAQRQFAISIMHLTQDLLMNMSAVVVQEVLKRRQEL